MEVIVFDVVIPELVTSYKNPHKIDPRTLDNSELCLWLRSIVEIEKELYEQLKTKNMFTDDELMCYRDVLGKDIYFLYPQRRTLSNYTRPNKIYAHVLINEGRYLGHVYSWQEILWVGKSCPCMESYTYTGCDCNKRELYLAVEGIRTSIVNMVERKTGGGVYGIGPIIISSVIKLARNININSAGVLNPIGPMPNVLKKVGFCVDVYKFIYERSSFSDITTKEYNLINKVEA